MSDARLVGLWQREGPVCACSAGAGAHNRTICDAPHGVGGSCTGRHQWYSGDSGITFGRHQRFHEFFFSLNNDGAVTAEAICQQAQVMLI